MFRTESYFRTLTSPPPPRSSPLYTSIPLSFYPSIHLSLYPSIPLSLYIFHLALCLLLNYTKKGMKYVIGNWKAYKSFSEVQEWLNTFTAHDLASIPQSLKVILCPPAPFLHMCAEKLHQYNISIGSQDISQFEIGPVTGEVTGTQLDGLAEYVIIGHSERRQYFHENDEVLSAKVRSALHHGLKVIFCIDGASDFIPEGVTMVVYEPIDAIGTGRNATVDSVMQMKSQLTHLPHCLYIYGGSVDSSNVTMYMQHDSIDGVLPGTAALNPQEFYELIQESLIS